MRLSPAADFRSFLSVSLRARGWINAPISDSVRAVVLFTAFWNARNYDSFSSAVACSSRTECALLGLGKILFIIHYSPTERGRQNSMTVCESSFQLRTAPGNFHLVRCVFSFMFPSDFLFHLSEQALVCALLATLFAAR